MTPEEQLKWAEKFLLCIQSHSERSIMKAEGDLKYVSDQFARIARVRNLDSTGMKELELLAPVAVGLILNSILERFEENNG